MPDQPDQPTFDAPVTKPWWESKTLWFNAITLILEIIVVLQQSIFLQDKVQILTVLTLIHTIGNVILRFISTQPLTLTR